MQKHMPKLNTNAARTAIFALMLIAATAEPILGVVIPLVLGLLEWGNVGRIASEQRVKFVYMVCGGLAGMLLNFGLSIHATQPELLPLL